MSYQCCKGCWTSPCHYCQRQLCPTSGHSQMYYDENEQSCCFNCYERLSYNHIKVAYREEQSKSSKMAQNIFDSIKQSLNDLRGADTRYFETISIIRQAIEKETGQRINN